MPVPREIRTVRLLLRPWHAADAERLLPVLQANVEHLGSWIPAHVAAPVALPALRERLTRFADDFVAAREWRYGIFRLDGDQVLGEVSVFPRDAAGRSPFAVADHAELGYWLRVDATGQGIATEAARAAFSIAAGVRRFTHAEIRCDARNARSAAVPDRLGFVLAATVAGPASATEAPGIDQVWRRALSHGP